jgi:hypothetical protein
MWTEGELGQSAILSRTSPYKMIFRNLQVPRDDNRLHVALPTSYADDCPVLGGVSSQGTGVDSRMVHTEVSREPNSI